MPGMRTTAFARGTHLTKGDIYEQIQKVSDTDGAKERWRNEESKWTVDDLRRQRKSHSR